MYTESLQSKLDQILKAPIQRSMSNSLVSSAQLHQRAPSASFERSISHIRNEMDRQLSHRDKPPISQSSVEPAMMAGSRSKSFKTPIKGKLNSSLSQSTTSFLPFQKVLESVEIENNKLKSELKEHNEEMKEISEKVQDLDRDNRKLRAVVRKLYAAEEASDEVSLLKEQYQTLSAAHVQLVNEANLISEAFESMKEEKERYYKKCIVLTKKIRNLLSDKETQEANQLASQETEQRRVKEAIRKIQTDVVYWKSEAHSKEEQLRAATRQTESLRVRLQEIEDIHAQDKATLLQDVSSSSARNRALESELANIVDSTRSLKERLQSDLDASERRAYDQITILASKLHTQTTRADNLAKKEIDLKREVNEITLLNNDLLLTRQRMEEEFAKVSHQLKVNREKDFIIGQEQTIQKEREKDEKQNAQIEQLRQEVTKRESELQRTFADLNHANEMLSTCQVQLESEVLKRMKISDEKQQIEEELSAIQSEIKKYKLSLASFKETLAASQANSINQSIQSSTVVTAAPVQGTIYNKTVKVNETCQPQGVLLLKPQSQQQQQSVIISAPAQSIMMPVVLRSQQQQPSPQPPQLQSASKSSQSQAPTQSSNQKPQHSSTSHTRAQSMYNQEQQSGAKIPTSAEKFSEKYISSTAQRTQQLTQSQQQQTLASSEIFPNKLTSDISKKRITYFDN